jgi:hypothetical protein
MASVYSVNKGINAAIEFRGLKSQYIAYMAVGLVIVLVSFAILYLLKVTLFFVIPVVVVSATFWIRYVYGLSNKYGQYGLQKKQAFSRVPDAIFCRSRKFFYDIKEVNQ